MITKKNLTPIKKYIHNKRFFSLLISLLLLIPLYYLLYKLYIPRVSSFGCFDDCFNIMGGYFMLKGKTIYADFFFNHQMLMAYISAVIQLVTKPENMYELILVHRKFLLLYSFCMAVLLVIRFRVTALSFLFSYELTKFYLFGNRFLAEAMITYPLVYMAGIIWKKLHKQPIFWYDYLLSAFFGWFVLFMREPFIPLAGVLLLLIFWNRSITKSKLSAVIIFLLLTIILLINTPISDWIFNVITINRQTVLADSVSNDMGQFYILKVFFYPMLLLFGGEWNVFRYFEIGFALLFLYVLIYFMVVKKQYKIPLLIIFLLGIANLRAGTPGHIFYSAFHMLPWYAIFLFFTFSLLKEYFIGEKQSLKPVFVSTVFLLFFLSTFFSPKSYIYEKPHPHEEFLTQYGNQLQVGETVKKLSSPGDSLFLDGFDDLIYWQADLLSSYKYTWFTSVMPYFPRYTQARLDMFANNPPDFYYGSCPKETIPHRLLPPTIRNEYNRLYEHSKPSCLFVTKEKLRTITDEQWRNAEEFGYSLTK